MGLGVDWVYNYLILIVALLVMDVMMAELRNQRAELQRKKQDKNF